MADDCFIEGMKGAAGLMCWWCFRGAPLVPGKDGGLCHALKDRDGVTRYYGCNAAPICRAITDLDAMQHRDAQTKKGRIPRPGPASALSLQ